MSDEHHSTRHHDGEVIIPRSSRGRKYKRMHTDPTCPYVKQARGTRSLSAEAAARAGFDLCQFCDPYADYNHAGTPDKTCDRCGNDDWMPLNTADTQLCETCLQDSASDPDG
jgi:hypothetical protein